MLRFGVLALIWTESFCHKSAENGLVGSAEFSIFTFRNLTGGSAAVLPLYLNRPLRSRILFHRVHPSGVAQTLTLGSV
jgi:hypothetical protein